MVSIGFEPWNLRSSVEFDRLKPLQPDLLFERGLDYGGAMGRGVGERERAEQPSAFPTVS
jgi:hypothetical protein